MAGVQRLGRERLVASADPLSVLCSGLSRNAASHLASPSLGDIAKSPLEPETWQRMSALVPKRGVMERSEALQATLWPPKVRGCSSQLLTLTRPASQPLNLALRQHWRPA